MIMRIAFFILRKKSKIVKKVVKIVLFAGADADLLR